MTDDRQAELREALDDVLRQRDDDTSVRRYAAAATAFLARYGDDLRAALAVAQVPAERLDVDRLARAIAGAESQAPDDANDEERREWHDKAERIADRYPATPSAQETTDD